MIFCSYDFCCVSLFCLSLYCIYCHVFRRHHAVYVDSFVCLVKLINLLFFRMFATGLSFWWNKDFQYLGNRWTDLRQIHTEDVLGPSLGRAWWPRSISAACTRFMFGKHFCSSSEIFSAIATHSSVDFSPTSLLTSLDRTAKFYFLWTRITEQLSTNRLPQSTLKQKPKTYLGVVSVPMWPRLK